MICQKCGTQLKDGAAFCTVCGMVYRSIDGACENEILSTQPQEQYIEQQPSSVPQYNAGNVVLYFQKNSLQWLQQSNLNCIIDYSMRYEVPKKGAIEIYLFPGLHTIQMSFPYMGGECGTAVIQVNIEPGKKYQLTYKPPFTVFSAGTILTSVIGVIP